MTKSEVIERLKRRSEQERQTAIKEYDPVLKAQFYGCHGGINEALVLIRRHWPDEQS